MKILIVAAAAGLIALSACTPTATNNTTIVENTVVEEANVSVYENASDTAIDNAMPAMNETVTMNETGNSM